MSYSNQEKVTLQLTDKAEFPPRPEPTSMWIQHLRISVDYYSANKAEEYMDALEAALAAANHRADEAEKKLAELDQGFCTCPADWSDGTAYCQNCGKKVGPTQPEQTK